MSSFKPILLRVGLFFFREGDTGYRVRCIFGGLGIYSNWYSFIYNSTDFF
jgi:hypothetical protein